MGFQGILRYLRDFMRFKGTLRVFKGFYGILRDYKGF